MCLQFVLLIVLYVWSPSQQTLYVFFIIAAVWGLGDGMLITQIVSKSQPHQLLYYQNFTLFHRLA